MQSSLPATDQPRGRFLSVRLSQAEHDALKRLAAAQQTTVSRVVREVVLAALATSCQRQEDRSARCVNR